MNDPQPAGPPIVAARAKRQVNFRVPADMVVYAAFLGKPPQIDPRLADPIVAANHARRENPWSPAVLSIYLRELCKERAQNLKMNRPELTAWLRRQAHIAHKRFTESQHRIAASRKKRAA